MVASNIVTSMPLNLSLTIILHTKRAHQPLTADPALWQNCMKQQEKTIKRTVWSKIVVMQWPDHSLIMRVQMTSRWGSSAKLTWPNWTTRARMIRVSSNSVAWRSRPASFLVYNIQDISLNSLDGVTLKLIATIIRIRKTAWIASLPSTKICKYVNRCHSNWTNTIIWPRRCVIWSWINSNLKF